MMSDSDDTDNLLLIPPDLFVISSLDSDNHSDYSSYSKSKSSVVSELVQHMQTLEYRILAIESKENSNNSLNNNQLLLDSVMNYKQKFPRTKFSVSQNSNIQKTPTKSFKCASLPTTPSIQQLNRTNEIPITKSYGNFKNNIPTNFYTHNRHDSFKCSSESVLSQYGSPKKNVLHVGNGLSKKPSLTQLSSLNFCENNMNTNPYSSLPLLNTISASEERLISENKQIKDMSVSEVDEFLQDYEKLYHRRNDNHNGPQLQSDPKHLPNRNYGLEKDNRDKRKIMEHQKFKFSTHDYQSDCERRREVTDCSVLNDTSIASFDTEQFLETFKPESPMYAHESNDCIKINIGEEMNFEENEKFSILKKKENYISSNTDFSVDIKKPDVQQYYDTNLVSKFTDEFTKSQTISSISAPQINQNISNSNSCPNIFKTPSNMSISNTVESLNKKPQYSNNESNGVQSHELNGINLVNSIDSSNHRPQGLLTLSDFWNNDSSKSLEEQLKIKLEEERFRREHCEQLIQNLQKKLLEQQEKIAVAVRLDNEKNSIICQFQASWKKTKQKICDLESEKENFEKLIKSISEKHQSEINNCHEQIKKYKEELSKALNLATGYKEKSDSLIQEKVDLLKDHTKELQDYKSHVQQAETRYEEIKVEYQKLLDKNKQTDDTLKIVQQDLNKELLKSSEVRNEMAVIHKALDSCETELIILRQEKENLQLKLKEEASRNTILEQAKASIIIDLNEAKQSEKSAKNEVKLLTDQQEKLRAELRDVYQKQVDEVVKAKLEEFQTQLDSAEMIFQNEIETKQLAIAECAARKIKSVIDKHKLEISLVEEKHREEKKLYEIKVAQATQKAAMLDAQLNSYRKSKNQLVEQLHSMLQKQWQQALLIISGGNGESMQSIQKISVDKLFSIPNDANLELIPNHCSTLQSEPMKLDSQKGLNLQNMQIQERHNESFVTLNSHNETPISSRKESKSDLRKYIKMILDMQLKEEQSKPKFFRDSPIAQKENSEKQSSAKDNTSNEGSSSWQPEISVHDTSEYLTVQQKFSSKSDKQKPPWK